MKWNTLLLSLLFLYVLISPYTYGYVEEDISKLNWHKVIANVLSYYHSNNIKPNDLEKYTHEYGNLYLYLLAEIETDIEQITGSHNINDKGTFQINIGWWSYENLSLLSVKDIASEEDILDNEVYLAAHIWLYNVCIYRSKYGRFPENTLELLAVYHNPNKLSNEYIKRISHVLSRNNIKVTNF